MPDNNDIDQAVQKAVNSILKSVNAGSKVSDAQLRGFLNAVGKAEDGANQASSSFRQVSSAAQSTSSAMLGFAGQLGRGNTAFTVVNTAIRGVSDGLGSLAKMIPIVGDGIAGLVGQVGKAAEFSVEQIEAGYGAFNQLSDVGLIGSKGIKGLAEDFAEAGIPLKTYTALISNSSQQLAKMNGTAHDVSQTFAESMGQMRGETEKGINGIDNQLRLLGYGTEDISETFINYADLQRRLGREQSFNSQTLKEGTVAYAKELDLIAKITGMSRKEQQKVVEAAMAESRWRATLMDLGQAEEKQMNALNNGLTAFNSELAQGMRDQATGFTQSEAAQRLFRTTNGASVKIMQQLTAGQISGHQALLMFHSAVKGNMGPMSALAKATGDQAGVYAGFAKTADFANASIDELGKASQTQADQTTDPDKITQGAVGAVVALEDTSTKIAAMFMDSDNASIALRKFADTTNMAAEAAYNLFLTGNETTTRQASPTEIKGNVLEQRLADINAELDSITMPQVLPYSMSEPTAKFEVYKPQVKKLHEEMLGVLDELNQVNKDVVLEEKNRVAKLTNLNSVLSDYGVEFSSGAFTNNAFVTNTEGENKRSQVLGTGSDFSSVKGVNEYQAGEIRKLLDASGRKGFELTKRVDENKELWNQIKDLITRPEVDFDSVIPGVQDRAPNSNQTDGKDNNTSMNQSIKDQTDAFKNMTSKLDTIARNTDKLVSNADKNLQIASNK